MSTMLAASSNWFPHRFKWRRLVNGELSDMNRMLLSARSSSWRLCGRSTGIILNWFDRSTRWLNRLLVAKSRREMNANLLSVNSICSMEVKLVKKSESIRSTLHLIKRNVVNAVTLRPVSTNIDEVIFGTKAA